MGDRDPENQLEDLFSGQEDPIRAIEPSEPSTIADEKRQQDQLREEEQLTISLETKSEVGRVVEKTTGTQRPQSSTMTALPQPLDTPSQGMELRQYLHIARKWWWLIVACTLLAATSAFLVSSRMPRVYRASATLLVRQAPGTGMNDYTAILTSERLVSTYSQMLSGRPVLEAVIALLDLDETPDALAKRVKVELIRNAQLILLSVEDTHPTWAALIANTIAETFIAQNEALQERRYANSLASMQEQIVEMCPVCEIH